MAIDLLDLLSVFSPFDLSGGAAPAPPAQPSNGVGGGAGFGGHWFGFGRDRRAASVRLAALALPLRLLPVSAAVMARPVVRVLTWARPRRPKPVRVRLSPLRVPQSAAATLPHLVADVAGYRQRIQMRRELEDMVLTGELSEVLGELT